MMVGQFVEVCSRRGLKVNLRCVLDESGTDGSECSRKLASGRRVAGAIRFIINARDMQLECARVLHKTLLVTVFM